MESAKRSSLIIGGPHGFARALGHESAMHGITPIFLGRSRADEFDVEVLHLDLNNPETFPRTLELLRPTVLDRVTHIFWVAGCWNEQALTDMTSDEIDVMINTNFRGPVQLLPMLHRLMKLAHPLAHPPGQPYHLVLIGSSSAIRPRSKQALYAGLKAGQAHFMRSFAHELIEDLPGSKVTIVHPGGMQTDLFRWGTVDTSKFMDPKVVALRTWDEVLGQDLPFREFLLDRQEDGTPRFVLGPVKPERPF